MGIEIFRTTPIVTGKVCLALFLLASACSSTSTGSKDHSLTTNTHGTSDASDLGDASYIAEPKIPPLPDVCPILQTGTVTVQGQGVELWVGEKQADKKGPVLFYWHGTGSIADEIKGTMAPMLTEIQSEGGIAASFTQTVGTGFTTGNNVWYTGDYDSADIILACAIEQLNIDTHRIYAAGCSAGGLQAGSMVLARSSYLAGAMPNSGGNALVFKWEDPSHIPSLITAHGSYDADFVILHFSEISKSEDHLVATQGGYAVDCDHGGGHCGAQAELIAAQWQFLKDHPFGVSRDPYPDGLPSSFPAYCTKFTPGQDY